MNYPVCLIYGEHVEEYRIESYCAYDELIYIISIFFPTLKNHFYILLGDHEGCPIYPYKKITNNESFFQILSTVNHDFCNLILTHENTQCFELQYGDENENDISKQIEGSGMKGLFKDLKKIKAEMSNIELHKEATNFLVGLTGSGKSTLVNFSLGLQLQCVKSRGKYEINPPELTEAKYAPIGNEETSCTTLPGFYKSPEGNTFCDLAGFLDTKGDKQQILNSYSNRELFNEGSLLRIIMVIQCSTLYSQRGGAFVDALKRLQSLFPYDFTGILKYSTMIVISKTDNDFEKGECIEYIQEIVDENKNMTEQCRQFLIEILKLERIFLFPKPRLIDNSMKIQPEENIHKAISEISPSILNFKATISLPDKTRDSMFIIMNNLQKEICNFFDTLISFFDLEIQKKNPEELSKVCTNLSKAIHISEENCFFPYDIDGIMYICELLNLKINYEKSHFYLGNLITNLRKCDELVINYKFATNLMDTLISDLKNKEILFHRYLENFYQSEEDLKEIQASYMKQQQSQSQQYLQKKQQLQNQLQNQQRQREQRRQEILNQIKRQHEQRVAENERKLAEMRAKLH